MAYSVIMLLVANSNSKLTYKSLVLVVGLVVSFISARSKYIYITQQYKNSTANGHRKGKKQQND